MIVKCWYQLHNRKSFDRIDFLHIINDDWLEYIIIKLLVIYSTYIPLCRLPLLFITLPNNVIHPLIMSQCFCSHTQRSWHLSPNDGNGHSFSQYLPIKPVRHATIHNVIQTLKDGFMKTILSWKIYNYAYLKMCTYECINLCCYQICIQRSIWIYSVYKIKHKRVRCIIIWISCIAIN